MTTMCPIAAAVVAPPANRRLEHRDARGPPPTARPRTPRRRCRRRRRRHQAPACPEPVAERVARIEEERGLARDERASLDARDELAVALFEPAGEEAARDRLLAPRAGRVASFPRAWSDAIFADVPVPQGERSYAPPGTHARSCGCRRPAARGGPNRMTWSTTAPPSPVTPCSASARWIASVTVRRRSRLPGSTGSAGSSVRKNQLPP